MKEINDIKIILGKYEKIFLDKDTIKKTEISLELKGKIYKDLQNKSIELKKQLMCLVNQLPSINENDYAITGTLNYCKKIEEKKILQILICGKRIYLSELIISMIEMLSCYNQRKFYIIYIKT